MHAKKTKKKGKTEGKKERNKRQIKMERKSITMRASMYLYKVVFICGYVNKENRQNNF